MISPERRERIRKLDEMLRSEAGLNLSIAAGRFGVQDQMIKNDLEFLKLQISPIARSGRTRNFVYRYAEKNPPELPWGPATPEKPVNGDQNSHAEALPADDRD